MSQDEKCDVSQIVPQSEVVTQPDSTSQSPALKKLGDEKNKYKESHEKIQNDLESEKKKSINGRSIILFGIIIPVLAAGISALLCFRGTNFYDVSKICKWCLFAFVPAMVAIVAIIILIRSKSESKIYGVLEIICVISFFITAIYFFQNSDFKHYFAVSGQKTEIQQKINNDIKLFQNMLVKYDTKVKSDVNLYGEELLTVINTRKDDAACNDYIMIYKPGLADSSKSRKNEACRDNSADTWSVDSTKRVDMMNDLKNNLNFVYNEIKATHGKSLIKDTLDSWNPKKVAGIVKEIEKYSAVWPDMLIKAFSDTTNYPVEYRKIKSAACAGDSCVAVDTFDPDRSFSDVAVNLKKSDAPAVGSVGMYLILLLVMMAPYGVAKHKSYRRIKNLQKIKKKMEELNRIKEELQKEEIEQEKIKNDEENKKLRGEADEIIEKLKKDYNSVPLSKNEKHGGDSSIKRYYPNIITEKTLKDIGIPESIISHINDSISDNLVVGEAPSDIPVGCTEIYFWGCAGSGKTCALAAILTAIEDNGYFGISAEFQTGNIYRRFLKSMFATKTKNKERISILPRHNDVKEIQSLLFDIICPGEVPRPIALMELPGEIFECFLELNEKNELPDEKKATFEKVKNFLNGKNQKIHFFFIEYDKNYAPNNQHVRQIDFFNAASAYFENNTSLKETTRAIYVVLTKSDSMLNNDDLKQIREKTEKKIINEGSNGKKMLGKNTNKYIALLKKFEEKIEKEFAKERNKRIADGTKTYLKHGDFKAFINVLNQRFKKNAEIELIPFSLGNVYFRKICDFNDAAAQKILDVIIKEIPFDSTK